MNEVFSRMNASSRSPRGALHAMIPALQCSPGAERGTDSSDVALVPDRTSPPLSVEEGGGGERKYNIKMNMHCMENAWKLHPASLHISSRYRCQAALALCMHVIYTFKVRYTDLTLENLCNILRWPW